MSSITRRSALSFLATAPIALRSFAATQTAHPTQLLIGTYTDPVGKTPGAKGIYSAPWSSATGVIGELEVVSTTPDPTFLALSPTTGMLFAVNELSGSGDGKVSAFARKPGQTQLQPLNVVDSGGNGPCHLAVDKTGRALFVANYGGGSVSAYKVSNTGLSEPVSTLRFSGHGAIAGQQGAPHTHCVRFSPDNRFLLVNDLGLDRIMVFHVDPAAATLTPAATPFFTAAPGAGPRHSIFHPRGKWVYSGNEINSTVDILGWNSKTGELTHKGTISSLPEDARGKRSALAELVIDPAGKFLYVSNRFHDSIGVFAINQKDGLLTPVQDMPCGGKTPRHFTMDPTGRWVIVANQDSRNIVVFERDHVSGKLTDTGRSTVLDAPVCILFA